MWGLAGLPSAPDGYTEMSVDAVCPEPEQPITAMASRLYNIGGQELS